MDIIKKNIIQLLLAIILIIPAIASAAIVPRNGVAIPSGDCIYTSGGSAVLCNIDRFYGAAGDYVKLDQDSINSTKAVYKDMEMRAGIQYYYVLTIKKSDADTGSLVETPIREADGHRFSVSTNSVALTGPQPAFPAGPATPTTPPATPSTPAGGELSVGFGTFSLKLSPDATLCPTGSTTYTTGILKGIPCEGAIDTLPKVLTIVKNVVLEFLLPTVGVTFIIMLLIGGILYITSRGNPTQTERAKKTLTGAIVGLLIVTLSYTIIAIFVKVLGGGIS